MENRIHEIYRNGRLYDSLDSRQHAIVQIARTLHGSYPQDVFTVCDDTGELYYEISTPHHTGDE